MAIQKDISTDWGFTLKNAYLKVSEVQVTKNKMTVVVHSLADSTQLRPVSMETYNFDYDINGVNPIEQGYIQLKKLTTFTGGTDV
jgi:hypothetical protein